MSSDRASRIPASRPEDAPDWSFWWDSNATWGWVCSEAHWRILCEHLSVEKPKALERVLSARLAAWSHPTALLSGGAGNVSFGFRREHRKPTTLRDHAEKHGLTWMLTVPGKAEPKETPEWSGPGWYLRPAYKTTHYHRQRYSTSLCGRGHHCGGPAGAVRADHLLRCLTCWRLYKEAQEALNAPV